MLNKIKKLSKIVFTGVILFLTKITSVEAQRVQMMYGIEPNRTVAEYGVFTPNPIEKVNFLFTAINFFLLIVIAPIVFLIGLTKFLMNRKKNTKKARTGKIIMIVGVGLAILAIILRLIEIYIIN